MRSSGLGLYIQLHRADAFDRALQMVAVLELGDTGGRAGREERPGLERRHTRQEADEITQAVDHVGGVRLHHRPAVLLDVYAQILRLTDLVASDDPRSEPAERIETLPDVPCVMPALA